MSCLLKLARLSISKGLHVRSLSTIQQKPTNCYPQALHAYNNHNSWIWQKQDDFKLPFKSNINPLQLPNDLLWVPPIEDYKPHANEMVEPPTNQIDNSKEAARLIVIRRKKMKKHKLRKLRKKMKYEWAKVRQRRELKKEKLFQGGLIQRCKEADSFSAEKYVEDKLNKLNETPIPKTWKGKRLPEFIIREKMGLPPK